MLQQPYTYSRTLMAIEGSGKMKRLYNILKGFEADPAVPYTPLTKRCYLCQWEKYYMYIITANKNARLNQRSDLVTECMHKIGLLKDCG